MVSGGSAAVTEEDSTKTVGDIIEGSEPRPENPGTRQYDTTGGFDQANSDFDDLNPSDVKDYGNGTRVGTLPDGRTVVVRPNSSGGEPTLEIQTKIGGKVIEKIKIRYND